MSKVIAKQPLTAMPRAARQPPGDDALPMMILPRVSVVWFCCDVFTPVMSDARAKQMNSAAASGLSARRIRSVMHWQQKRDQQNVRKLPMLPSPTH